MATLSMSRSTLIKRCNILVVGKAGSGKSTVANEFIGRKHREFKLGESEFSRATTACTHREVHVHKEDVEYIIKVVDTIGLFDETSSKTENTKTIDETKQYIQDCIPEGISLIVFVYKLGRFTPEEKEAFDFTIKQFGDKIKSLSALIITHCETKKESVRQEIVRDFRTNEATRDIARLMEKGILTVGFPSEEDLEEDEDLGALMEPRMKRDCDKLWKLVTENCELKLYKELFDDSFWKLCTIL